jgi:glutamate/tyrosine decarboxylase-like PLP-dependent enzyme
MIAMTPFKTDRIGKTDELGELFGHVCDLAVEHRRAVMHDNPYPRASLSALRQAFGTPLRDEGMASVDVIRRLNAAAVPGLVGSAGKRFHGWIIGASHPAGTAAEWLSAAWGQNAGLFESSPAAAVAEETAGKLLLDLLRLPDQSSVGFVTGATMASFTCLAAARWRQFQRHGICLEQTGMNAAPPMRVFLGQEAHSTIFHGLRMLGFGERDLVRIPSDDQGRMIAPLLEAAMQEWTGPAIVIAQAGHINSGAFDDFEAIAGIAHEHGAWLHVDGAFGLWAQACPQLRYHTRCVELADSWAIDGHKVLQVPYDSGYAIVRDRVAHSQAMRIDASYLPTTSDAFDPSHYVPELSRRARGFATWAVIHALGRKGIADLVLGQHRAAAGLAARLAESRGYKVINDVVFNQVAIAIEERPDRPSIGEVAGFIEQEGRFFVKTARWQGRDIVRVSMSGPVPAPHHLDELANQFRQAMGPSPLDLIDETRPGIWF